MPNAKWMIQIACRPLVNCATHSAKQKTQNILIIINVLSLHTGLWHFPCTAQASFACGLVLPPCVWPRTGLATVPIGAADLHIFYSHQEIGAYGHFPADEQTLRVNAMAYFYYKPRRARHVHLCFDPTVDTFVASKDSPQRCVEFEQGCLRSMSRIILDVAFWRRAGSRDVLLPLCLRI